MRKLLLLALLSAATVRADLLMHFKLNEGALDPFTNMVYSSVSNWTGVLGGSVPPAWITTGLPPIPAGGTTAALFFDATTPTPRPSVNTDFMGVTGQVARTVCAWIKSEPAQPAGGGSAIIVSYGGGSGGSVTAGRYSFRLNDDSTGANAGRLRLEIQGSGINGTRDLRDGQWHHVAVVHEAGARMSNVVFYVDGVVEPINNGTGLGTLINTVVNTAGDYPVDYVRIGNGGWAPARAFNGAIDDVRIYDHALSQDEILALIYGGTTPAGAAPLANQSIVLGDPDATATFTVAASGTPPLHYQWRFHGANLPGQTNISLVINPAGPADVGPYGVTVSNVFGTTNVSATLSLATAPIEPPQQAVLVGEPATLSVAMPAGSVGYTYQWRRGGTALPGATASSYSVASATLADDSPAYSVVVTLGAHSATSAPAILKVLPVPASAYAALILADSPAAYWRLGEASGAITATDQTGFHPGAYFGYSGFELGQTGALAGDADTASLFLPSMNFVGIPYSDQLSRTNGFTLEAWARPNSSGARQSVIACYGGLPNAGYELALDASGNWVFRTSQNLNPSAPAWNDLTSGPAALGEWTHLVATYDGAVKRLYTNGVLAGTQTIGFRAATGIEVRLGGAGTGPSPATGFDGTLDELAIYARPLSADQARDHYFLGALGAGVAPTITVQPLPQTLILGDTNATLTFSATAIGSPRLRHQWKKDGVNLPGRTASTLTLAPASVADLGTYSVAISNSVGGVVSTGAALSLGTGPVSPGALAVLTGASATFTLTGMPAYQTYTYQWKHAGANLPGATGASLTLPSVAAASAGAYSVVVTLGATSVESQPATLTVLPPPSTSYAAAVAADAPVGWWPLSDAPGSFFVTNAATPFVNDGSVFADVGLGAEGALLGASSTAASFTGYSLGARAGQSKIEVPASLGLNTTVFSVECWALPRGGNGAFRSPVTSRNAGTGVAEGYLFYAGTDDRWQFWLGTGTAWTVLTGPNAALHEWAHLVGTYDGATARFYVNGALVATTNTAFTPNYSYGLRIGAGSTEGSVGAQFFPGLVDEVAVYDKALPLARVQAHYAAAFQPNAAPRFTLVPLSRDTLIGAPMSFAARVHATPPLSLQWLKNGAELPGATAPSLTLNAITSAAAGAYALRTTSGGASVTSPAATLGVQPGEAVSINLRGFATPTIAGNGGLAGFVRLTNWNEVGLNAATGSATNLLTHRGAPSPIGVAWSANTTRQWNGPITDPAGDDALFSGFVEASTTNITLALTGIPAEYQTAGYALYVYFSGPSATAGAVNSYDWFGSVRVGATTNYYHVPDLAFWDGRFLRATNTNPSDFSPADANYAVFPGLSSPAVTVTVEPHPMSLSGPLSLSAVQLVAATAPVTPVPLQIGWQNGSLVLTWEGTWLLERKSTLDHNAGGWTTVPGAASPYTVPAPLVTEQYYRLRAP